MADKPLHIPPHQRMPAAIAGAVVLYFGASLFLPYFVHEVPVDPSHARSLSTLENILLLVIGFYFGSNKDSQRKTELLATKPPEPPKDAPGV